jgi:hypothetical protein
MDKIFQNTTHKVTIRNDNECFITEGDRVYAMSLRNTYPPIPETPVPVHAIQLSKPLTIVPEPVVEFTLSYPPVTPKMQVNDLVILLYKTPLVVGFIKSINDKAYTAEILPIAVNTSRGAIVFVDILPSAPDPECLYILKSDNTAWAYWDSLWHCVGNDVSQFSKALEIHCSNQALHVSPEDRKKWGSGGNFVGAFDTFAEFQAASTYAAASLGDFVLLRHDQGQGYSNLVSIYFVSELKDGIPQWYKAHLWDNQSGKFHGAFMYVRLLPNDVSIGDWAIVEAEESVYRYAYNGWQLLHSFKGRDFEALPIGPTEVKKDILLRENVVDNFQSKDVQLPLSANAGRILYEMIPNPNMLQHLFNFDYEHSYGGKQAAFYTKYSDPGDTIIMEYTNPVHLPKWVQVKCDVVGDPVCITEQDTMVTMRVIGVSPSGREMRICDVPLFTTISMLGNTWIHRQDMWTQPFLMTPLMKIKVGLYDVRRMRWPLIKDVETGNKGLDGTFTVWVHGA